MFFRRCFKNATQYFSVFFVGLNEIFVVALFDINITLFKRAGVMVCQHIT